MSVARQFVFQLVIFFCYRNSVVLFDFICRCHNTLFLSSPKLLFIMGLIRDLFVFRVNSLMS